MRHFSYKKFWIFFLQMFPSFEKNKGKYLECGNGRLEPASISWVVAYLQVAEIMAQHLIPRLFYFSYFLHAQVREVRYFRCLVTRCLGVCWQCNDECRSKKIYERTCINHVCIFRRKRQKKCINYTLRASASTLNVTKERKGKRKVMYADVGKS